MKKITGIAASIAGLLTLFSGCSTETTEKSSNNKSTDWQTTEVSQVSVHDPSVISVVEDGLETYYIFGSHLAQAKTVDMLHWEAAFTEEYENPKENIILGNLDENLKKSFEWAGKDDADSAGGYSIWAPDVIWNDSYVWADGTTGAYMYYYCTTSTWRRSCIGFAVSKTIEGPYEYADTIIYSGFSEVDSTDGSDRNINCEKTNIPRLIKEGVLTDFSENWVRKKGTEYNTDYAPNAIDPALFYDAEGKLWMSYGSWSGGIFILQMDSKTGQPIYPGKDSENEHEQVTDRYFGTKISGGHQQSGEGPYIVYDPDTEFYYLFVSYGALQVNGGYNMRLFRSENPNGPYVDAKGRQPLLKTTDMNSDYGIKLMSSYQFNEMHRAYKAQGHNSALINQKGEWLLFYHTRFSNSGEYHEVQVHQMVMNEEKWPVVLPYSYNRLTDEEVTKESILGDFEWINHGTDNDSEIHYSETATLHADQRVTGAAEGSWALDGNRLTIVIGQTTYKGVALFQQKESDDSQALVFSLIGDNNETIWGSQTN